MASPLRRWRRLIGLALLGGAAYVGWLLTEADLQPAAPIVERVASPAAAPAGGEADAAPAGVDPSTTCVEGFQGERFESLRGLTAGLACLQDDGSWRMEQGVTIRLEGQGSAPPLRVRSQRGVLPPEAEGVRPLLLSGSVVVEGEGDVELLTEELELYRARTLAVCPGPTRFRRALTTGSAGSLRHDWGSRETLLEGGATVVLAGEEVGDRPITVRGSRILHRDGPGLIEVRGGSSIELEGGRVSGERIDVSLTADRKRVARVEAIGGAETLTAGTGLLLPGGSVATRRLRAARIVHVLGPGNDLESIEAHGSVVMSGSSIAPGGLAGREQLLGETALLRFEGGASARLRSIRAEGAPAQLLTERGAERSEARGEKVELGLGEEGGLRRLAARGGARVFLSTAEGGRSIEGDEVEIELAGESLDVLRFRGAPAVLQELAPGGAVRRTLSAGSGDLRFGPEGEPVEGFLEGAVRAEADPYRASGRRLDVKEGGALLVLEGQASLEGPGRSSHGERAVYDRVEDRLAVVGEQHTIVTDPGGNSGLGDFVSGREPVLISAERMDVDLSTRRVVYSAPQGQGRPDVRQGDVTLRGDVITLDEDSGDLMAEGSVESKLRLAQPDGRAHPERKGLFDPTGLIIGTCERFRYERAASVVRYDGDVRLEQGTMALSSEEVEVGLKKESGTVEYLRARRRSFYDGPDFQAEGELIDFDQAANLVRIEGGRRPARAVREGGNVATGAVLELDLDEDDIRITAPYGGRTRGRSSLAPAEQGQ